MVLVDARSEHSYCLLLSHVSLIHEPNPEVVHTCDPVDLFYEAQKHPGRVG